MRKERQKCLDCIGTLLVLIGIISVTIGLWIALPTPVFLIIYGVLIFLTGCVLCALAIDRP